MSAVLDLVRERRPPFSPEAVVAEFAEVLKSYGIHEVVGDTYGGEWPRERFLTYGIHYRVAAKTKSEIFQSALPMLNSERVELLDNKTLHTQLVGLERRTSRGGKDSIDHRPGGRDDVVNAAAGVLTLCVPTIPITPDCFARGVISFGRPDTEEHRRLYDCAKNNKTALYPRSGNTYLRLLIRSAFDLRTHTLYGSGDRRSFGATPGLLEAVGHIDDGLESQALINVAKASDHIHFVKTHEEPLTDDPAIYIVRDGRSAIVSYWHFLNEVERVYISMEAVIEGNVYAGSWSQHYANWNPDQRPHTCVLRYEELVREPQLALDAIGRVSGITAKGSLPPDFATLRKMRPHFFRAADDRSNLAEAAAYQQLIDAKHGELLKKLKYII